MPNEITKRVAIIATAAVLIVLSISSCSTEDSRNYWKTRQVCVENGGSVITRFSPTGNSAANCELSGSPVEGS